MRNKTFSLLNILGLSIGLAASIIILLYVSHEKSFDSFHNDAERIYRITMSFKNGDAYTTTTTTPYRIAPLIKSNLPEIASIQRMSYSFNSQREIKYGEKKFNITDEYAYVDPNFFDFFSFSLIEGNPKTVFNDPLNIILTESEAKKLFGNESAMGKTVSLVAVYDQTSFDLKVAGIMKDIPSNSHFHYSYFMPMKFLEERTPSMAESWGWTSQNTYIKLEEQANISSVNEKLESLIKSNAPEWYQEWAYLGTQPMLDIHLKSHLKEEIEAPGDSAYVQLLTVIAFFIIVIACINYMNLATSLATKRAKEVGIKKTVGAEKSHLVLQFLFEAVLTTILSAFLAVTFIQLLLPYFNDMIGQHLSLFELSAQHLIIGFILIILLGIFSGSYPAFFLSSFNIISTLSGKGYRSGTGTIAFRKGLVIIQFAISSFLICATIIILNQWNYLRNRSLGLNTELVISIPFHARESVDNYQLFKSRLMGESDIVGVSASSKSVTGRYDGFGSIVYEDAALSLPLETIDDNFFELMNIPFDEGRSFSRTMLLDSLSIIMNKKAVLSLGIEDPIGKKVGYLNDQYTIIGVVDNFHFEPLYTELGPVVFFNNSNWFNFAYLKLKTSNFKSSIDRVENIWDEINTSSEFNYSFVEDEIQKAYNSEQKFFWIFIVFSTLAIVIACLGLFGLAGFTVSQKIKEIGIRKALGATSSSIAYLLSRKFMILVLFANLISWPAAYFIMVGWLEKFPYRTSITLWIFVISALISIVISIISVGGNAVKASLLNPVKSLRYE